MRNYASNSKKEDSAEGSSGDAQGGTNLRRKQGKERITSEMPQSAVLPLT